MSDCQHTHSWIGINIKAAIDFSLLGFETGSKVGYNDESNFGPHAGMPELLQRCLGLLASMSLLEECWE